MIARAAYAVRAVSGKAPDRLAAKAMRKLLPVLISLWVVSQRLFVMLSDQACVSLVAATSVLCSKILLVFFTIQILTILLPFF